MRSLAAVYDWLGAGRPEEEQHQRPEPPDYRLRALPREDIHLYVKPIDNTNVVRVVDKKDWMANIWVARLGAAMQSDRQRAGRAGVLRNAGQPACGIPAPGACSSAGPGARAASAGVASAESQQCRSLGWKEVRRADGRAGDLPAAVEGNGRTIGLSVERSALGTRGGSGRNGPGTGFWNPVKGFAAPLRASPQREEKSPISGGRPFRNELGISHLRASTAGFGSFGRLAPSK